MADFEAQWLSCSFCWSRSLFTTLASHRVTKTTIVGWTTFLFGLAVWLYGYLVVGQPSLIDWHAHTPWWIADYLPNLESEIGMLLCTAGMVPMYWPTSENK